MKYLNSCIDRLLAAKTVGNIAVKVGMNDRVLGEIYRSAEGIINKKTLFDMASVTKILATANLILIAIDKGRLSLEDPVSAFFPSPTEKKNLTILHLLTHRMGIGHKSLNHEGNTYENIGERILQIPCDTPIGSRVLYSCPAYILLGKIAEKVFGKPLDLLFEEKICIPLGMGSTCFLPTERHNIINSNPEGDLSGIVNDYNCRFLGGVAGNAGVFSNMDDMTAYVEFLRRRGAPLLSSEQFTAAIQNHTPNAEESRGLGFLYVDERYSQTGGLFPAGSIGHCGHTGQSVFLDPNSGLYVIILSDATVSTVKKYGKENYNEVMQMRAALHRAIQTDLSLR